MKDGQSNSLARWISLGNLAALAFSCLLIAFIYFTNWHKALSIFFPVEYEGPIIWAGWQLLHGMNIYSPESLTTFPWVVTIYPPGYLLVSAALIKTFGLVLWPLRTVSMLSTIASAWALYSILRHCRLRLTVCLTALVLFLAAAPVCFWSFKARTDMLAAAFSFWALERFVAWCLNASSHRRVSSLWVVILLSVLGFLTKQESIVVVPSVAGFLIWQRLYKPALWYLAGWLIAVGAVSLALQAVTGGYFAHLTFLSRAGWSAYWLFANSQDLAASSVSLVIGLCILLYWLIVHNRNPGAAVADQTNHPAQPVEDGLSQLTRKLPLLLFVSCTLIAIYHLGIPASHVNAFVSISFALSWCVALALSRQPAILTTIVLLSCIVSCESIRFVPTISGRTLANTPGRLRAAGLAETTVLSEDPFLNLLTHSGVVMVDCATFNSVWLASPKNWQPIADAIASRQYGGIIVCTRMAGRYSFWPDQIISLTRANYHFFGNVTGNGRNLDLYLPKLPPQQ